MTEENKIYDLETAVANFVNKGSEEDIPLEINRIDGETRKRLEEPLIYEALDYAMELHKHYLNELRQSRQNASNEEVYPILGNTIQVIFEYLNGSIKKEEFMEFKKYLEEKGQKFIEYRKTTWKEYIDIAFFTPSSSPKPMRALMDWDLIKGKYDFLIKMKETYLKK